MNMHRFTPLVRYRVGKFALSLCGGLLLALSLLLPPAAYAVAPSTPSLSTKNAVNLAGVSVVRLVMSYVPPKGTTVVCTALGTLIASWPATSTTDQNNWIVTDSSMLSLTGGTGKCAPNGTNLASIQILANNLYTNSTNPNSNLATLAALICDKGACHDPASEFLSSSAIGGGMLFSFHTDGLDMQPFLDTGSAQPSLSSDIGIELAAQGQPATWPLKPQIASSATALTFLTPLNAISGAPTPAPSATSNNAPAPGNAITTFEPGMPIVDTQAAFIGMKVSNSTTLFTVSDLNKLVMNAPILQSQGTLKATNTLKSKWDDGIQQFDQNNFLVAKNDFGAILDRTKVDNTKFQAANNFAQQAAAKLLALAGTPTPTASPSTQPGTTTGFNSTLLLIGLVAGVIFLVFLLVLVSLVFGRRRALRKKNQEEMDRFKEEAAAARRNAPQEARRIAEESQRRRQPLDAGAPAPYAQAAPPGPPAPQAPPSPLTTAPLALPVAPQPQPEQQPPTQQPDYAFAPSDAFDTPTMPIIKKNGHRGSESQKEKHVVRELHNVSLAVGSLSNVGIKRQHKPNEDSLFAVQGARTFNSLPQQFGLFVIADGMGGHANGGDASRTAIQNMIDFMLPRISVADPAIDDQGYLKLLEEGVQHANLAVHQRNLQDRADMGTTMTTALVIGAMAYIANVGDSRTYLYRQSTGLSKVTRDHSVVASLVDAGIIKPDDIYTHPKRNQIYRSLGEKQVVEVDTFTVELQAGDKLLLCSDGLWDLVRDPDIQRIIASTDANPNKTTEELIQAALDGGGDDNVSVIVVSITEIDGHTGLTGINFLSKPDTVTMPEMPT